MTSYKYDKGETFYVCKFCNYHLGKNRHSATAEVYCCEEYEDAHGQDGFQLKDGCICYDRGASEGKQPEPQRLRPLHSCRPGLLVSHAPHANYAMLHEFA